LPANDPRLDTATPLTPGDAVACIIVVDGEYLLQLRDMKHGIFFPGCWGCFGGNVDPGETEVDALVRELNEEIGWAPAPTAIGRFSRFDFDLGFANLGTIWRVFYEASATRDNMTRLHLREGAAVQLFPPSAILTGAIPLTPYDAFALWFHINQRRLVGHPEHPT
jgi:8-oxo-dGTP pyrophosphatase MutT (NUDIX family)